ncbi:phospholipid/cholesterol/gamma-HCH transport system substrate-binding protein [Panacagrimonas perspica]|uniref:Phospholipid/cholesterol/gamma-HCH transport system substrate-binding protein n=1 Tax=Panacagrimonas perspica TaxID=381431 RepID=A0A4R7NZP5_9GAMM|nr:outer membrane lipid asymmetry maintenance protein MlaD [Panacagrimonas perspica]TDU26833.1 phospholipid/cholesterol/gamma-HCH transport system substrate-binding protein [Panacagrimonas perspica]THD03608.1 outer membrane lipid asymmetry maintenance protein MlaD [Panacagrimonas perspica]
MQSRALEMLVGLFVCLGVAAVFVLTFRVASLDTVGGAGSTYRVVASFENIGGLKQGSAVTMAGVKIGRVRDIVIDPNTYEANVTLELSNTYNTIPEDSNAKILTAGLLGEQYVGIEVGGADEPLKDGSKLKLTQSALVLENLIGQFLSSQGDKKGDTQLADAIGKLADSLGNKNSPPPGPAAATPGNGATP